MKKRMLCMCAMLMVAVLAVSLAACGQKQMADGVYTAQADDAYVDGDGYGWRDTLVLKYEGGQLVEAVFDSYNAEGAAKSVPGNYEGMEVSPSEWVPQLSDNIKNAASPDEVDTVAGASIASENARKMYKAILEKGKPGETIDVVL